MDRPTSLPIPLAVALCFLLAPLATATSVVRMNLSEMTAASHSIVYGTIVSSQSRWNEDRSLIVTDVRIRVLDTIKGDVAGEVVVTQPGGVVGKLKVEVPGVSAFRHGQEVILFLAAGQGGEFHVSGLSQGRFDVIENPRTGAKTIRGFSLGRQSEFRPKDVLESTLYSAEGSVPLNRFLDGLGELVREVGTSERKSR